MLRTMMQVYVKGSLEAVELYKITFNATVSNEHMGESETISMPKSMPMVRCLLFVLVGALKQNYRKFILYEEIENEGVYYRLNRAIWRLSLAHS